MRRGFAVNAQNIGQRYDFNITFSLPECWQNAESVNAGDGKSASQLKLDFTGYAGVIDDKSRPVGPGYGRCRHPAIKVFHHSFQRCSFPAQKLFVVRVMVSAC